MIVVTTKKAIRTNPYIATDVDDPEGDSIETVTGWKHLSWVGRRRRQVNKYLPRDKIITRTFGKAVRRATHTILRNLIK